MPRAATGSIDAHAWADGRTVTYRIRVRAYGERHHIELGTNHEGWNESRAQVELDRILRLVERGTWEPPTRQRRVAPELKREEETFHVFASRWWAEKEPMLSENARSDYRWRLDYLLGHFHRLHVSAITVREVDSYRAARVAERPSLERAWGRWRKNRKGPPPRRRPLSNRSINMTLDLLAQMLDDAVEYKLIDVNPARGRKRRLPAVRVKRNFLEPDMVLDLLEVADEWEQELPRHQRYGRRAFIAALALAGPRISELTGADRGLLDLEGGRLRVGQSKTVAGLRDIEITAYLQSELGTHAAQMEQLGRRQAAGSPLFPTRTGGRHNASNVRTRLLAETVRRANARREGEDRMMLPESVTPHTLRRTFASMALAAGRDPRWVMAQLGHTDARLTLTVYAQVMQRQRVDEDLLWAFMRFVDEPIERPGSRTFGTRIGTTRAPGAAMGLPGGNLR